MDYGNGIIYPEKVVSSVPGESIGLVLRGQGCVIIFLAGIEDRTVTIAVRLDQANWMFLYKLPDFSKLKPGTDTFRDL